VKLTDHPISHMAAAVLAKVERARNMAHHGDFRGARLIRDQLNASTAFEAPYGAIIIGLEIAAALRFQHPSLRATAARFEEGR